MWGFAVYFALAKAYPTTFLISNGFALLSQASVMIGSVYIGRWLDATPRLKAMTLALIVQNLAVVLSFVFILLIWLESDSHPPASHLHVPWSSIQVP